MIASFELEEVMNKWIRATGQLKSAKDTEFSWKKAIHENEQQLTLAERETRQRIIEEKTAWREVLVMVNTAHQEDLSRELTR